MSGVISHPTHHHPLQGPIKPGISATFVEVFFCNHSFHPKFASSTWIASSEKVEEISPDHSPAEYLKDCQCYTSNWYHRNFPQTFVIEIYCQNLQEPVQACRGRVKNSSGRRPWPTKINQQKLPSSMISSSQSWPPHKARNVRGAK